MGENSDSGLIMFYGQECDHCHEMMPLLDKLEKEENVSVERLEVWHDDKNMAVFQKADDGKCGAVPFFHNKKSEKWLCGAVNYEKLKEWALS